MDNRVFQEIDNVEYKVFPMSVSPIDYQITIHVTNMINTYDKPIIKAFKYYLYNPESLNDSQVYSIRTKEIIQYYGVEVMRDWFNCFYGWEF